MILKPFDITCHTAATYFCTVDSNLHIKHIWKGPCGVGARSGARSKKDIMVSCGPCHMPMPHATVASAHLLMRMFADLNRLQLVRSLLHLIIFVRWSCTYYLRLFLPNNSTRFNQKNKHIFIHLRFDTNV
jgi:hypothetical protein